MKTRYFWLRYPVGEGLKRRLIPAVCVAVELVVSKSGKRLLAYGLSVANPKDSPSKGVGRKIAEARVRHPVNFVMEVVDSPALLPISEVARPHVVYTNKMYGMVALDEEPAAFKLTAAVKAGLLQWSSFDEYDLGNRLYGFEHLNKYEDDLDEVKEA